MSEARYGTFDDLLREACKRVVADEAAAFLSQKVDLEDEEKCMKQTHFYVIKVLNLAGEWYTNALVQNSFDAIQVAKLYRDQLGYGVQIWYQGKDMSFLMNAKTIEMEREKDEYLENLYITLEMCNITLQYREKFNPGVVASAERIKRETEELIKLREIIH